MKAKAIPEERLAELDPRERHALAELRKSMRAAALDAEGVGEVLPEAVVLSQADGGRLPKSMVETTERAIGLSVEENPEVLSEALFPVIGPAIRKAVARLVSETLARLDAGLEKGLSPKRLGWRLQSLRSGIPYYEIALRNTLDYRVEYVFLIHKKTGILLADASRPDPSGLADKDTVASMLTAIRDYIKDSLSLGKGETVDVLSAGEYSIFVEEGPLALLALVVRGKPDPSVRELAQDALETVHARLGPALRGFEGETAPFEKSAGFLAPCLVSAEKGAAGRKPARAIVLLCLLAALGAFFAARGIVAGVRDRAFVAALEAEPGMVVVRAHSGGGKLRGTVMQAVGARSVAEVAAERNFDQARLDFEIRPYIAPGFAAPPAPAPAAPEASPVGRLPSPNPRVASPPAEAARDQATGTAAGAARGQTADAMHDQATGTTAGTARGQTADAMRSQTAGAPRSGEEEKVELAALEARLSGIVILFDKNSERLSFGQGGVLQELQDISRRLVGLSLRNSLAPRIEAVGHAAGLVRDAAGDSLSVRRARAAAKLAAEGSPDLAPYFVARGTGNAEPLARESQAEANAKNRSVTFTATFR